MIHQWHLQMAQATLNIGPGLPAGWTSIEPNAVDATLFHAQYPRMMQHAGAIQSLLVI